MSTETMTITLSDAGTPEDGTGTIYVDLDTLEATWDGNYSTRLTARGPKFALLQWAFHMPSAETKILLPAGTWADLDQGAYDAFFDADRGADDTTH